MEAVDLLMVGHFAKDKLIVDGVSEDARGGGVYYGSIASRRLGCRVAVATRLRAEDFPLLDKMKAEGVQVFATPAGETSGIANYYQSSDMERRTCVPLGFAGAFQVEDIPILPARVIVIASIIAGEVELPLLQELAHRAPVALDAQGFVRMREGDQLNSRPWKEMDKGLAATTYLKVDQAEAEILTGRTEPREAVRVLAGYGPQEILLTQTSGVTVYAGGQFHHAAFTPRSLAGRTGRGDTCFSTYLSMRLAYPPEVACAAAGWVTSRKQEKPGPWQGNLEEVRQHLGL